jgi:O-antigen/teichoic acid export membrane protein
MSTVRRVLTMNTQATIAVAFAWSLLLGVFGRQIFHLWLRTNAVYSSSLILLMLSGMFPFALGSSFSLILQATNQIHRAVLLLLAAGLVSLAATAAGARWLGVNGAGLGMLVFETLGLLVVGYVASKYAGIQARATLASIFSRQSLAAASGSAMSLLRNAGSRLSGAA